MIYPNANKLLFILTPSLNFAPIAYIFLLHPDPAKSTRKKTSSSLLLILLSSCSCMYKMNIFCDYECRVHSLRFARPLFLCVR